MRILVVGAGAVGGYFGARLAMAGRDVTFLVRARRAETLLRDGVRVVSPHGNFRLDSPMVVDASQISEPYDLILLSVKGYTLESAMNDLTAAVGPNTVILPTLNGMKHVDSLAQRFGQDAVIGGACRIVSKLDEEERIVQMADVHSLIYGELSGGISPRIRAIDALMQGAGFDAAASAEMMQEMWVKWVNLGGLGAICCLLGGSVGQVSSVQDGKAVAEGIASEALAVAAASGYAVPDEAASRIMASLSNPASGLTSSMFRDMTSGSDVEAEQIVGDMVARADAKGVPTPLLRAAAVRLRVYDATRNG